MSVDLPGWEPETWSHEEHAKAREGKITGSRIKTIMNGGWRAWNSLVREMRDPTYRPFIEPVDYGPRGWGHRYEPQARAIFWDRHPEITELIPRPRVVPYWAKRPPWNEFLCYSPDMEIKVPAGIGGAEFKCPYKQPIFDTLRAGIERGQIADKNYVAQVQFQIMVGGKNTLVGSFGCGLLKPRYFVAFDPRRPESEGYAELLVTPDYDYQDLMWNQISRFLDGYSTGEAEPFGPATHTARKFNEVF